MQQLAYTAILPCHNASRTLAAAVDCLKALQPPPERILVVDDGSTDETAEIACRNGAEVIALAEQSGPSRARNAGARAAETPWLLVVDADCYLHADGFAQAAELLEREPDLDGVMGVFEPDVPSGPLAGKFKNFFRHYEITGMDNPPHIFTSSAFLIRKQAYENAGGFNEAFGTAGTEDNEFYFRFLAAGHRLKYLPEFQFTHDKPMGLWRLLREDCDRARSIILNMRGRLGTPRKSFARGEKAVWAIEILSGWGLVAGLPIWLGALFFGPPAAAVAAGLWILAGCVLTLMNGRTVRAAAARHGMFFAGVLVWYRALEMMAATCGIAAALCSRQKLSTEPASQENEADENHGRVESRR